MIKALSDIIIGKINHTKDEVKTSSGIFVGAGSHTEQELVVVSVGEEVKYIKPGDTVLIDTNSGKTITDDGESYTLIRQHQVLALKVNG